MKKPSIGTHRISNIQRRLLDDTIKSNDPLHIARALQSIATDAHITSNKENVLPDWISIYNKHFSAVSDFFPQQVASAVENFFAALRNPTKSLSTLNPNAKKLVFLLGAGASKPAPSNIPTVKELLPQLLDRGRRLDRDDVSRLADFCEHKKISNIEDLLTAAQIATFCGKNANVLQLINHLVYGEQADDGGIDPDISSQKLQPKHRIPQTADLSSVLFLQDTLHVLFGLLSNLMLPAKPNLAHQSIAQYAKKKQAPIITTNYDCCIDLALDEQKVPHSYGLEFKNPQSSNRSSARVVKLLKLHGSLNWYYCETCQDVQLVNAGQTVKAFNDDSSTYPVIGICKSCGGQQRGLLVPPLSMKFDVFPPLSPLLEDAKAAFQLADVIVVVGFSFADADVYISRLLSKSLLKNSSQKLLIVDPDWKVGEKIERKIQASIPNFDQTRVICIHDDCTDFLPKFLNGSLLQRNPNLGKKPARQKRA